MFRFENPQWLYGLLVFLPLLAAAILVIRRKNRRFARLGDPELVRALIPDYSVGKQYIKYLLLLLAGISLVLALANPQMGTTVKKAERKGVDLMVALDISNSMNCEDIQPSRLMRSKQALIRLLDKLGNDRIGLVVFAGDAFLQLPLTSDYGAAKLFISEISTDDISTQGTSIGAAIDLCLQSFEYEERENGHNKAIIVISDGEDHEAAALTAAQRAAKAGVAVHTIGMGLPQGGLIPVYANGRIVDYKKDRRGQTVMTKLNEDMLRQIAAEGKGSYVGANNTSAGIEKVFDEINRLDKTLLEQRNISDYESRYQWPLIVAIVCLLLDIVIFTKQHRRLNRKHIFGMKEKRNTPTALAVTLLAIGLTAMLWPAGLYAQTVPLTHQGNRLYGQEDYPTAEEAYRKGLALDSTNSRLLYNLGNAQYKQGLYPQAAEQYAKVLQNPYLSRKERAHAAHNLGNAYMQTQAYAEAVNAYKQALRQRPEDADTKYNLAYAQKLLQQQQQQQQQQNNNDQKEQQEQQDGNQQNQQNPDQQNPEQKDRQDQQGGQRPDDDREQPQDRPDTQQGRESQEDRRKKNDAEKILQALENQEKKTLDKVKKKEMPTRKKNTEKDW